MHMTRVVAERAEDVLRRLRRASMGEKRVPCQASYPFDEQEKPKKKIRRMRTIKEIKRYQRSTDLLIPRLPFRKIVKEMASKTSSDIRFQSSAMNALQEATEAFIVGIIEDGMLCTIHAQRVTLMAKDVALAARIRGDKD